MEPNSGSSSDGNKVVDDWLVYIRACTEVSQPRALYEIIKEDTPYDYVPEWSEERFQKERDIIKKKLEANRRRRRRSVGYYTPPIVPSYDESATRKEMAYPLNKIIGAEEWDSLLDIHALYEAGQDLPPGDDYPSFVRNRFHLLGGQKDEKKRKELACILSYITHLIKVKDRHSLTSNSARDHTFPRIILQKISIMFAPLESCSIPEEKKKLLITNVLVLTLFVDDFDTNPFDIAKDLRMNETKLKPYFEYLGCKMHTCQQGNSSMFELRLPLEFPKPKGKRSVPLEFPKPMGKRLL